jgi:hypothetical protein
MNYEKFKRSDRPDRFRSLTLLVIMAQISLLLSPSDGLASFLKTTLANGVKVVKKVISYNK